jgi:hypothetical protein
VLQMYFVFCFLFIYSFSFIFDCLIFSCFLLCYVLPCQYGVGIVWYVCVVCCFILFRFLIFVNKNICFDNSIFWLF